VAVTNRSRGLRIKSARGRYWENKDNQRNFLEGLSKELGLKDFTDWNSLTESHFIENGGAQLLKRYGGSISQLMSSVLMETSSNKIVSKNWESREIRRKFMEDLGHQLGFQKMEDWYTITSRKIKGHGGAGLLAKYGGSPSKLVIDVFKDFKWRTLMFNTAGKYWESKDNERDYLDYLGNRLGLKQMKDWYNISVKQFSETSLIQKYSNSPAKLLRAVYYNHSWSPSKFNIKLKDNYWAIKDNRVALITLLTEKLHVMDLEEWYQI
jgi:hypothetical protein